MSTEISREDVRPSQIQYQLLTAQLAIGSEWEGPEDAPDGVNEALEHIQTAMSLVSNPGMPLDEARPDAIEFTGPSEETIHSEMDEDDWQDVAESEFVDVASGIIPGDQGFVFDHPEIGLHGFRWRGSSGTLEAVSFERPEGDAE